MRQVFVANPNKPPAVLEILRKNQDRMLRFLSDFQARQRQRESASQPHTLPPSRRRGGRRRRRRRRRTTAMMRTS